MLIILDKNQTGLLNSFQWVGDSENSCNPENGLVARFSANLVLKRCLITEQVVRKTSTSKMESHEDEKKKSDIDNFNKTPVPLSKSPGSSPSIRSMTQTVIVSLAETVTHNITYGKLWK